jgi:hypothetical protein
VGITAADGVEPAKGAAMEVSFAGSTASTAFGEADMGYDLAVREMKKPRLSAAEDGRHRSGLSSLPRGNAGASLAVGPTSHGRFMGLAADSVNGGCRVKRASDCSRTLDQFGILR